MNYKELKLRTHFFLKEEKKAFGAVTIRFVPFLPIPSCRSGSDGPNHLQLEGRRWAVFRQDLSRTSHWTVMCSPFLQRLP